jgi:hypothetical protein
MSRPTARWTPPTRRSSRWPNAEVEAEKRDAAYLDGIRRHVHELLKDVRE